MEAAVLLARTDKDRLPERIAAWSMIRKSGYRFSEKIMLK
jgi:hypothetical protein